MLENERLLALSNSSIAVQGTINKILQSGFAGHQTELEKNLANFMAVICIMDNLNEVSMDRINELTNSNIATAINQIKYEYHITEESPESIRQKLKLVEVNK